MKIGFLYQDQETISKSKKKAVSGRGVPLWFNIHMQLVAGGSIKILIHTCVLSFISSIHFWLY